MHVNGVLVINYDDDCLILICSFGFAFPLLFSLFLALDTSPFLRMVVVVLAVESHVQLGKHGINGFTIYTLIVAVYDNYDYDHGNNCNDDDCVSPRR